jgi:hypothetical protein
MSVIFWLDFSARTCNGALGAGPKTYWLQSTRTRERDGPGSCANFNLPARKFDDLVHLDENATVVRQIKVWCNVVTLPALSR